MKKKKFFFFQFYISSIYRLGIRIVLLIRDPRGVLQSRKHREWCPTEPDCFDPGTLCSDMVADYHAAITFSKLYPDSFR